MTLEILNSIFEASAPSDYNYYSFDYFGRYNDIKQVENAMVLVFPSNFPLKVENKAEIEIEFLLGKVVPINTNPKQGYAVAVSELQDIANNIISTANTNTNFFEAAVGTISPWGFDKGFGVNSQFWVRVKTRATIWFCEYAPFGSFLTEHNNGYFIMENV